MNNSIFFNRRHYQRRIDPDPCGRLPLDLYHRKRRKSAERRRQGKSLAEDYYSFINQSPPPAPQKPPSDHQTGYSD